jgi:hypothetical protein
VEELTVLAGPDDDQLRPARPLDQHVRRAVAAHDSWTGAFWYFSVHPASRWAGGTGTRRGQRRYGPRLACTVPIDAVGPEVAEALATLLDQLAERIEDRASDSVDEVERWPGA